MLPLVIYALCGNPDSNTDEKMYLTRPRSVYQKFRSSIPEQQILSETPSFECVVITDEESEELDTFCSGICRSNSIKSLPFPQDRILKIVHTLQFEEASTTTKAWFLPVLDQPLSSNRYYIIKASGKNKGRAYTCAKVEGGEGTICCFNKVTKLNIDTKPKRFGYRDVYQQFEIHRYQQWWFLRVVHSLGWCSSKLLRTKGWEVYTTSSFKVKLIEAQGLINSHQRILPKLDFPLHSKRSDPIAIGRWYCPFVFVKEDMRAKDQMQSSLFYEVTLKQWWEEIYSCENETNRGNGNGNRNVVVIDANVKRRVVLISGMEAVKEATRGDSNGDVWFKVKEVYEKRVCVGLSSAIFEKMRCLQERRGWFDRKEIEVKVDGEKRLEVEKSGKDLVAMFWLRVLCLGGWMLLC